MPGGPGRFGRGSSGPALLRVPTARGPPPPTGLSPPAGRPSSRFGPAGRALPWALLPRGGPKTPPVWAPAPLARRYAGHHCCLLLLRLLGCFGSPGARPLAGAPGLQPGGLPHSDTPGSPALCASPGIFAAARVLHRLREPGHPPCALPSLPARSRRAAARGPRPFPLLCFLLFRLPLPGGAGPSGGPARPLRRANERCVENAGLEPAASCLQSRRSTS